MDEKLYRLKDTLCNELEKYASMSNFDTKDIEMIKNLSSACKNLMKICMAKEEEMGGSQRGSYRGGSYDGGGSNRGGSYRRGYSRDGDGGGSYHDETGWLLRKLENARSYASGEREKQMLQEIMDSLRE